MKTKDAYKIVLKDMLKNGYSLFRGRFDAKNGNIHYMYGINTVMEFIANEAGNENFNDIFLRNFKNCIDKAKRV